MKIKKIIKNNIFGIVLGVILCTCIGVFATTTNTASEIKYATSKNANVENVNEALDALYTAVAQLENKRVIKCYNGTCGKLSYRYWNNNFVGGSESNAFDSSHMPENNYASRAELETAYGASNFAERPTYIRSVLIEGTVIGHEACLWYNNREFCIAPKYWGGTLGTTDATVATNTKIKFQREMENALGLESTDIWSSSGSSNVFCGIDGSINDLLCYTDSSGVVMCGLFPSINCAVNVDGTAHCNAGGV